MWRIIPRLYLGDEGDSRNRFLLEQYRITHIVNCAGEVRSAFSRDFNYLRLELRDPDPAFVDCIAELCDFIHAGRRRGARAGALPDGHEPQPGGYLGLSVPARVRR